MIGLRLRVRKEGTTYIYDNGRLLEDDAAVEERIDDIDIEVADIDLTVIPNADGNPEFLGVTDPLEWPDGETYRAELSTADGRVLLNGAVRSDDVDWDDKTQTWRVPVTNEAQREFWSSLQKYADDVAYQYEVVEATTPPRLVRHTVQTYQPKAKDLLWYDLVSVVEMMLADAGMTYTLPYTPPMLYEYEYETAEGAIATQTAAPVIIGSGHGRMPHWTGEKLIEQVARYAGWRIRAEYKPWPSPDIEVTFVQARWSTGGPAVDDGETEDAHGIFLEGIGRDYALQVGEIDPPAPDADSLGSPRPVAMPPCYASYAPDHWDVLGPYVTPADDSVAVEDDREPRNEELERVEFKICPVIVEGVERVTYATPAHEVDVVYGRPWIEPAEGFSLSWAGAAAGAATFGDIVLSGAGQDDDQVYVAQLYETGGDTYIEHGQVIDPDDIASGQSSLPWSDQTWSTAYSRDSDSSSGAADSESHDAILLLSDVLDSGEDLESVDIEYSISERITGDDAGTSTAEASIQIDVRDNTGTSLASFFNDAQADGLLTLDGWTLGAAHDIRIQTSASADADGPGGGTSAVVEAEATATADSVVLNTTAPPEPEPRWPLVGSVWARSAVQGHQQRRAAQRALEVDVITDADITVADPSKGFEFRGAAWTATTLTYDTRTDVHAIEGRRAARPPAVQADTPPPQPASQEYWTALNLDAKIKTYPSGRQWLIARWGAVPLVFGRVWTYEVETDETGGYIAEPVAYGTHFVKDLTGTSPSIPFQVRVRPRFPDGTVGRWQYDQAA